ncbi:EF-P beta-lysylation protein EpmB [uncultured Thiohalocapsa sp.]|uniref:EF-P beta-lysylation protein EpmB n=1 Tax=uncultured Thiohalocapsa sp. TaxID=768990 RepID=UPI0025EA39D7|nr:EF-P beta-lysylation protein EpmB [uncultured Thiohalocapsa sp.]
MHLDTMTQARSRVLWQQELAGAFTAVEALLDFLGIPAAGRAGVLAQASDFRLLVPRGFAELMRRGDPHDPLLRQVLPLRAESAAADGFGTDPVGELAACTDGGLLRKYHGRALLIATGGCAVHCRYCFRRHFPYATLPARGALDAALAELAAATDVHELILSGGDPLLLDDHALADLLGRVAGMAHLRRIRVHSRLPIVLPSRVTPALGRLLAAQPQRCVLVIHANHPAELGAAAADALAALGEAGVTLLNQSVLLRGVNDDADCLTALSERLFDCGVLPYYLHQLDPVAGAAHFAVDDARARTLATALRSRLPGYLTPLLVRELPGAGSKLPLL